MKTRVTMIRDVSNGGATKTSALSHIYPLNEVTIGQVCGSWRLLLLYGCQVTRMLLRGENSNRVVFGRSKVVTTEPSEHFTTETLTTNGQ